MTLAQAGAVGHTVPLSLSPPMDTLEINQDLEELIQSIEDEAYNTRTFNGTLESEIKQLRDEVERLVDYMG